MQLAVQATKSYDPGDWYASIGNCIGPAFKYERSKYNVGKRTAYTSNIIFNVISLLSFIHSMVINFIMISSLFRGTGFPGSH